MEKHYIDANQLLEDSFRLAWQVFESGYRPNFVVGVWRGGAPVGVAVHELLDTLGVDADHFAIRTLSYTGIGERDNTVQVHGLEYLLERVSSEDSLLLVDDVHDTGHSLDRAINALETALGSPMPDVRIATPYFKPANNQTGRVPDYFLHETDQWLVFPHELDGLTIEEIAANKPALAGLVEHIAAMRQSD